MTYQPSEALVAATANMIHKWFGHEGAPDDNHFTQATGEAIEALVKFLSDPANSAEAHAFASAFMKRIGYIAPDTYKFYQGSSPLPGDIIVYCAESGSNE